ncbi:lipid-A-disaccharide synthase [Rhodopseudomonas palustris]|uniref:lipid-A-disaccharide synthase n=1 Tax=Rhodopseudomonas palustris TaxID=1076 RepID=UPI002ACDF168|nr:lipid-A-disaccharide synthase [Rhodopseudomonas palustris]WQH00766.1 lipid-A-disaccharide synthase [Rhodopseudomonas palustris]
MTVATSTKAAVTQAAVRRLFVIATEESGDRLGAALMRALKQRLGDGVVFEGVGGRAMAEQGLVSLFPIEELSIMGISAVVRRLPSILRRIRSTAEAVLLAQPDMLIIIDSPDFTHRVARRVRARDPSIAIVNYVSPTVWAWRPGRARAMRRYVDHVLALLPFEPEEYRRLQGPPCTYVGHPLTEQIAHLRPSPTEQARRDAEPPVLVVLPGSRRSEIFHQMAVFGETLKRLQAEHGDLDLILPTVPHLREAVEAGVREWPVQPRIVVGDADKKAAFRIARAAFAKSGTVTLELALAQVPMVAVYKAGAMEAWIGKRVIRSASVILANLVVGDNVVPEFIQEDCVPEKLVPALREVLSDTPMRARQLAAFARIDDIMSTGAQTPSARAAEIVLNVLRQH